MTTYICCIADNLVKYSTQVIMVSVSVPLRALHVDPLAQLEIRVMLVWLENLVNGVTSETQALKEKMASL